MGIGGANSYKDDAHQTIKRHLTLIDYDLRLLTTCLSPCSTASGPASRGSNRRGTKAKQVDRVIVRSGGFSFGCLGEIIVSFVVVVLEGKLRIYTSQSLLPSMSCLS